MKGYYENFCYEVYMVVIFLIEDAVMQKSILTYDEMVMNFFMEKAWRTFRAHRHFVIKPKKLTLSPNPNLNPNPSPNLKPNLNPNPNL